MNNNNRGNNNNNRRRGRGNNNRPQGGSGGGGGGQQLNRIDSRARGNAPQLLEKYRKLAQDAHLNGDRVQAEYYLQFADHYFRVSADSRVRQDEQRSPRQNDRWQEGGEEGEESSEFGDNNDFPSFDQPPAFVRREREERPQERQAERPNAERQPERQNERPYDRSNDRPRRDERPEPVEVQVSEDNRDGVADEGEGNSPAYAPPENPFVRENRGTRGLRPRREDRRPPRDDRDEDAPAGLDPSMLPPAISAVRDEPVEEAPAKKPRGRPRKITPGADETLESVS